MIISLQFITFVLLLLLSVINGYVIHNNLRCSNNQKSRNVALSSTFENDIEPMVSPSKSSNHLEERRPLKTALLALAARTNRGQLATANEKDKAVNLVTQLESFNPTETPCKSELIRGTWELVFSTTYLFRSSPFFMAARAFCNEGDEADRFNMFCRLHYEALAFTQIGKVSQIITESQFISEFDTKVAIAPGLPINLSGTIRSISDIVDTSDDSLTLYMDKVTSKENSSNFGVINTIFNSYEGLSLRDLASSLKAVNNNYKDPRPVFRTYYLDKHMRISRDQDDNIFVYNRIE